LNAFDAPAQQGSTGWLEAILLVGTFRHCLSGSLNARSDGAGQRAEHRHHLTNRTVELEVIPACEHYGSGLIPWSPNFVMPAALGKRGRRMNEWCDEAIGKRCGRVGKRLEAP